MLKERLLTILIQFIFILLILRLPDEQDSFPKFNLNDSKLNRSFIRLLTSKL